jgi:hypothetical protein
MFFKSVRLSAGHALSIFAYNNIRKQYDIKIFGGISFFVYDEILHSNDEMMICKACFQVQFNLSFYNLLINLSLFIVSKLRLHNILQIANFHCKLNLQWKLAN